MLHPSHQAGTGVITETMFDVHYNGAVQKKIFGTAMASLVSVIVANIE